MRIFPLSSSLVLGVLCGAAVAADGPAVPPAIAAAAPAPAPAHGYSTSSTTIGALLADPAARAVLERRIPKVVDDPRIGRASDMTLKSIQPFAHGELSDDVLAQIDAELAKLPPS